MGKKGDDELAKVVEKLIDDVGEDRERLTSFLDNLISTYSGEASVGIAEYVAKLVDALTKQHAVKTSLVKALVKSSPEGDQEELDEIHKEIGLPFNDEDLDEGSN